MIDASDLKALAAGSDQPLYQVTADAIRQAIDAGRISQGAKLPSTKALSEQLGVSLVTVHRALQALVNAGVLRRSQGRGTFVHEGYHARAEQSVGLRFGLVFQDECSLGDSYHGQILEGVRRGAMELGVDLVLLRYGEDWRNECQGLIFVNPLEEQLARNPWFGRERRGTLPIMLVGSRFGDGTISVVDTDNEDIGSRAVSHLWELGHRRIAYVGGDPIVSNNQDRLAGYCATLDSHGVPFDESLVLTVRGWQVQGERDLTALRALLTQARPTAVVAAGYYFALDVYRVAASAGLTVPGDLSVVGIDDPPSAALLSPALTTIRQPLTAMGRMAIHGLFDHIASEDPVVLETTLKGELVARGSTSGPAAVGTSETRGIRR